MKVEADCTPDAPPAQPAADDDSTDVGSAWANQEPNDTRDMRRLGKKQEFKRNFGFWPAMGFVSIYLATWEFVLVSLDTGFASGGFAGLFWCFIGTVLCYSTIVASLAEMASMAPTAGGQYHWVSEFAPEKLQKVLSYASGWMSTLGWVSGVASGYYVVATQVEAMVDVYLPDWSFASWQLTLVMWLFIALTIVFNTYAASMLPLLEIWSLVFHVLGFFFTMIVLVVLAPKNSAYEVFARFENTTGYDMGAAILLSQITVLYCNFGSDSVVHIGEEVSDASLTVPRCMWWAFVYNAALGIAMLIVMLFCIGPLDAVLASDIPYLILFDNTGYKSLSMVLNLIVFLLIGSGNITALATCAREVWAFARDKGLPYSGWIGKMNTKYHIPFNSVYATSVSFAALALIQIGSTLAFNIVVSLTVLGLMSTYTISIGCVLLKRIKGEPLPPARWSLGRFGLAINAFATAYSSFIIVWSCFPVSLPVKAATANWAPAVWAAVIVLSVGFYVAHGSRHYTAPVEFVEGRKARGVGLQETEYD